MALYSKVLTFNNKIPYIQGLIIAWASWAKAQGPLTKFYGFQSEIAIKWKFFFIKTVKSVGKNVLPNILKTLNDALLTSTDLYVHIMYFNSSIIFQFLGRFKIGAQMHIRPWAHSWLNRALPKSGPETCYHSLALHGEEMAPQLR